MDIHAITEKIGEYWDGRAPGFDADHNTEDTAAWLAVLARLLGHDVKASVVDVGSGTGFLANLTAGMGFPSIGLDASAEMLRIAVSNAEEKKVPAVYMKGSALELPFMDNTVDHIVNARLLWTLIRPDDALREWLRVIKPGGGIFCFNRFKTRMGEDIRPNFYANKDVDNELAVLGASEADLVALMTRNGLVDVVFEPLNLPLTGVQGEHDPWYVLRGRKPRA